MKILITLQCTIILSVLLLSLSNLAQAQNETVLTANDGRFEAFFGTAVAIGIGSTPGYAVVGVPRDGDLSTEAGAAYIFVRDFIQGTWTQHQKLIGSGHEVEFFGFSVAINPILQNFIVVGAPREDTVLNLFPWERHGAAYVYRRNGISWSEQARLVVSEDLLELTVALAIQ